MAQNVVPIGIPSVILISRECGAGVCVVIGDPRCIDPWRQDLSSTHVRAGSSRCAQHETTHSRRTYPKRRSWIVKLAKLCVSTWGDIRALLRSPALLNLVVGIWFEDFKEWRQAASGARTDSWRKSCLCLNANAASHGRGPFWLALESAVLRR